MVCYAQMNVHAKRNKPTRVWNAASIPTVLHAEILSWLPIECFADNNYSISLVNKEWRQIGRVTRTVARITHPPQLRTLVQRTPFVSTMIVDGLDEVVVRVLLQLRQLRCLKWRNGEASAFGRLPEILAQHPFLNTLCGSRSYFLGLVPEVLHLARACETLMVDRPGAGINGCVQSACRCGEQRFIPRAHCPRSNCVTWSSYESAWADRSTARIGTQFWHYWVLQELASLRDMLSEDNNATDQKYRTLLLRLIRRHEEMASFAEERQNDLDLEKKRVTALEMRLRVMTAERFELRGALAAAQEDRDQLAKACGL